MIQNGHAPPSGVYERDPSNPSIAASAEVVQPSGVWKEKPPVATNFSTTSTLLEFERAQAQNRTQQKRLATSDVLEESTAKAESSFQLYKSNHPESIVLPAKSHRSTDASGKTPGHTPGHNGFVKAFSSKQTLMAKSTAEAEAIATDIGFNEVESESSKARDINLSNSCSVVEQDNQACIQIVTHGSPLSARSKHMRIRFQSMKDSLLSDRIRFEWTKSGMTTSDIETKSIFGHLFFFLRARIQGYAPSDVGLSWVTGK